MTIYAVFDRDAKEVPAVVAERFSWLAFLLPPLFALRHGLLLALLGWLVAVLLLGAGETLIGGTAAFWLYVLVALWFGFEAPALRGASLRRRGWRARTALVAADADLATVAALSTTP